MRRHLRPLLSMLTVTALLAWPGAAVAASPRPSLPTIEREVMCASCGVPLNIAQSPQADRERAFIQNLIDRGETDRQIKQALVAQFGSRVLATPSNQGFGLAAYLVPLAGAAAALGALSVVLPRWRRRTRDSVGTPLTGERTVSSDEAARLDADLARFDR